MLSGALAPDYGEIRIDGQPTALHQPAMAQKAGIATVFQEFNLFDQLSVAENLFLGDYPYRSGVIDWQRMRRDAREFLSSFGLTLDVRQKVGALSVASKQLLEIAKAIRSQARILILDEPTAVLGGADVSRLLGVMRDMRARGVAMIFVSHRLGEVLEVCDQYVVLRDGVLVDCGPTSATSHDDLVTKMVGRQLSLAGRPRRPAGDGFGPEVLRVERLTRSGVLRDVSLSVREGEIVGMAGLRGRPDRAGPRCLRRRPDRCGAGVRARAPGPRLVAAGRRPARPRSGSGGTKYPGALQAAVDDTEHPYRQPVRRRLAAGATTAGAGDSPQVREPPGHARP